MQHFLDLFITFSTTTIKVLKWVMGIQVLMVPLFLFYRYMRDLQLRKQQLIILQQSFDNKVLKAEVEIQEQAFQNISRDIHDNIGQKLSVAKLCALSASLARDNNIHIANLIEEAMNDLRDLSRSLSSDTVASFGLSHAMQAEVDQLQRASIFKIELRVKGEKVFLETGAEKMLYRIFQEGLQNAIKHSGASEVVIELNYLPKRLLMNITDNGKGFTGNAGNGSGINNMSARAKTLGGTMDIESAPGQTTVKIAVPIKST